MPLRSRLLLKIFGILGCINAWLPTGNYSSKRIRPDSWHFNLKVAGGYFEGRFHLVCPWFVLGLC